MELLDGAWLMGRAGRERFASHMVAIKMMDGKSDGWCLASAKHHPQQSQNSRSYRPDSFTDEVSFE